MLSIMLADEYGHGFGAEPRTLDGRARRRPTGRRRQSVQSLARIRRWRGRCISARNSQRLRTAGERALALNPMDACTAAYVGQTLAYSGDWDRGCALIARATTLNPHHPGWYW